MTYRAALSNDEMDCMWGFFCEGPVPIFHYRTQTQLHRLGGWGEFAGVRRRRHTGTTFELFSSRYGTGADSQHRPWAGAAFGDLQAALQAHGYQPLRGVRPIAMPAVGGGQLAEIQRPGPSVLVVMATWTGQTETEAIVMCNDATGPRQSLAISLLRRQVQRSLRIAPTPPEGATSP